MKCINRYLTSSKNSNMCQRSTCHLITNFLPSTRTWHTTLNGGFLAGHLCRFPHFTCRLLKMKTPVRAGRCAPMRTYHFISRTIQSYNDIQLFIGVQTVYKLRYKVSGGGFRTSKSGAEKGRSTFQHDQADNNDRLVFVKSSWQVHRMLGLYLAFSKYFCMPYFWTRVSPSTDQ